ncbi:MAG: cation-transporting P-type ATPase, partial [Cyanobacteria bacterium J06639_1]
MTLSQVQPEQFYGLSSREIIEHFQSNVERGLTAEAVARRYEQYGWNELPVKPGRPAWLRFLL